MRLHSKSKLTTKKKQNTLQLLKVAFSDQMKCATEWSYFNKYTVCEYLCSNIKEMHMRFKVFTIVSDESRNEIITVMQVENIGWTDSGDLWFRIDHYETWKTSYSMRR